MSYLAKTDFGSIAPGPDRRAWMAVKATAESSNEPCRSTIEARWNAVVMLKADGTPFGRATIVIPMHRRRRQMNSELSDEQVKDILVQAMVDVGGDPALVYAFKTTGVYVNQENEVRLAPEKRRAFDAAIDEYFRFIDGSVQ